MNLENAGHYRKHYRIYKKRDASSNASKTCNEIEKTKFLCCLLGTTFVAGLLLGCLVAEKKR